MDCWTTQGTVFPSGFVADPTIDVYQESLAGKAAADDTNISLC